jgi:hypothetical protein
MVFRVLPPEAPVRGYEAPEIQVDCPRCKRTATVRIETIVRRFGTNLTMGELARKIALAGKPPCGLADSGQCGARALEPPVWMWANLERAWRGGWTARLYCQRHHAAMKPTSPCPEVVIIDVETLVAALGGDFKLERLRTRMMCPRCHTHSVDLDWVVPDPAPPPLAPAADVLPLRLAPTPAEKALRKLRVVGGGRQ